MACPSVKSSQSEGDEDETEEEATARKKLKADKAAALAAKKKGNEMYAGKVIVNSVARAADMITTSALVASASTRSPDIG